VADRFGVDIQDDAVPGQHLPPAGRDQPEAGAVPIGGMATALPNPDPERHRAAAEAIRADKQWEAEQGFIRGWVAHIFH